MISSMTLYSYGTIVAPESYLQLIEDGCLSSIVQTHNDDFVLCRKHEKKEVRMNLNVNWISPHVTTL